MANDPIQIKSIDDLTTNAPRRERNVIVEMPNGQELSFTLRELNLNEWNRIERAVTNPAPPIRGVDKNARPVYNYYDTDYLRAIAEANEKRTLLHLLAALELDVPGDSQDEQLQWLQEELPRPLLSGLVEALNQTERTWEARVIDRAEQFQPNGASSTTDHEST